MGRRKHKKGAPHPSASPAPSVAPTPAASPSPGSAPPSAGPASAGPSPAVVTASSSATSASALAAYELPAPRWLAAALAILCFVLYANSLAGPFVFDDHEIITQNRAIRGSLLQAILWYPSRAFANATFWVNYHLPPRTLELPDALGSFGSTLSYHLASVGLHALNAVLVFFLLRNLLGGPRSSGVPRTSKAWRPPPRSPGTDSLVAPHATLVAFVAAALWAAHPLDTMAVAYVAQRYALLAAAGVLGSVLCYATLRRRIEAGTAWGPAESRGSHALLAGVVVLFGAGVLSKQNAIVTPVLLTLVEAVFFGPFPDGAARPEWLAALKLGRYERWIVLVSCAPFAIVVALYRFFTVPLEHFFPPPVPGFPTRLSYFETEWVATLGYVRLFFCPTDLSAEQSFPRLRWEVPAHAWAMTGALVVHGLVLALAVLLWRRGLRFATFAIAWIYVALSVESSFIPIIDPLVEHRFYLPSTLLVAALVYGATRVTLSLAGRPGVPRELERRVLALALALLVVLGLGTVVRNRVWQSETGLWQDTLEKRPACARAWSSLGMQLLVRQDPLRAVEPLGTSLELGRAQVEGWNNLGKAYLDVETTLPDNGLRSRSPLLALAEESLRTAIAVNERQPSDAVRLSWSNLGFVLLKRAQRAEETSSREALALEGEAAKAFVKSLDLDPHHAAAWLGLGQSYGRQAERTEGAERHRLATLALEAYQRSGAGNAILADRVVALGLAGQHAEAFAAISGVPDREQSARTLGLLAEEAIAFAEEGPGLEVRNRDLQLAAHEATGDRKNQLELELAQHVRELGMGQVERPRLEAAPPRLEALADAFARAGDRVSATKGLRAAARVHKALGGDAARTASLYRRAIDLWPAGSPERVALEAELKALAGS